MSSAVTRSFLFFAILMGALTGLSVPRAEAAGTSALLRQAIGERIVIAGRQRMLAEGMAAKLCLSYSGVESEANSRELYMMWNIFRWYHASLRTGNIELGLSIEANPDVLRAWREIDQVWGGLSGFYEEALDNGGVDPLTFQLAMDLTGTVTDGASNLVATLRSAYAEELGPRGFGNALLIDLYERQRMLAQKIAKDVCLIAQGDRSEARRTNLMETAGIFAASLDAFQNGLADVGVPPPPSEEIAGDLAEARHHWQTIAGLVASASLGNMPSAEETAAFAADMDLFIASMTGAINALTRLTTGVRQ